MLNKIFIKSGEQMFDTDNFQFNEIFENPSYFQENKHGIKSIIVNISPYTYMETVNSFKKFHSHSEVKLKSLKEAYDSNIKVPMPYLAFGERDSMDEQYFGQEGYNRAYTSTMIGKTTIPVAIRYRENDDSIPKEIKDAIELSELKVRFFSEGYFAENESDRYILQNQRVKNILSFCREKIEALDEVEKKQYIEELYECFDYGVDAFKKDIQLPEYLSYSLQKHKFKKNISTVSPDYEDGDVINDSFTKNVKNNIIVDGVIDGKYLDSLIEKHKNTPKKELDLNVEVYLDSIDVPDENGKYLCNLKYEHKNGDIFRESESLSKSELLKILGGRDIRNYTEHLDESEESELIKSLYYDNPNIDFYSIHIDEPENKYLVLFNNKYVGEASLSKIPNSVEDYTELLNDFRKANNIKDMEYYKELIDNTETPSELFKISNELRDDSLKKVFNEPFLDKVELANKSDKKASKYFEDIKSGARKRQR
jgi:L-rhamnose mutarotase